MPNSDIMQYVFLHICYTRDIKDFTHIKFQVKLYMLLQNNTSRKKMAAIVWEPIYSS